MYAKVGVEEYRLLDPDTLVAECYVNENKEFRHIRTINIKESDRILFLTKEKSFNVSRIN